MLHHRKTLAQRRGFSYGGAKKRGIEPIKSSCQWQLGCPRLDGGITIMSSNPLGSTIGKPSPKRRDLNWNIWRAGVQSYLAICSELLVCCIVQKIPTLPVKHRYLPKRCSRRLQFQNIFFTMQNASITFWGLIKTCSWQST